MTPSDADGGGRTQVNLRLDRALLDELDEAAAGDGLDRAELARRILVDGIRARRMQRALADYRDGRRSTWSAAELAGVSLYEMLDRIHDAGIPYRLDEAVLERLGGRGTDPPGGHGGRSGPSRPRRQAIDSSDESIEVLRTRYRPERVSILFVGESSPAGGTYFYRANSKLYRAIREAMQVAMRVDAPDGPAFLDWFRGLGYWLVDLADAPVNDLPRSERGELVRAGIPRLANTIRETRPDRIVVVKADIGGAVHAAAQEAEFDDRLIDVLPFPVRQWRSTFVEQLSAILRAGARRSPAVAETAVVYEPDRLHEAMAQVLRDGGNRWMSARSIADEIARRELWRRPSDGAFPRGSQISARARRYPKQFQVSENGIRLRAADGG